MPNETRMTPPRVVDARAAPAIADRRAFGATDLRVSPLGLGSARIGGEGPWEPFVSLVSKAVEYGINFFDTADMYRGGDSESILGRALAGRRDRVVIATKVGYVLPARRRLFDRAAAVLEPFVRRRASRARASTAGERLPQDFSPAYVRRATESCLRRLRTDFIDLLQLHSPPATVIRQYEWSETLDALKREGKIRHYGIACYAVEDGFAALEHAGVESVQVRLNLLERSAADALVPSACARGVAVIARECLASGLLAKGPRAVGASKRFGSAEETSRALRAFEAYREVARELGVPLPALALKYALAQAGVSTVLLGLHSVSQLDEGLRWLAANDVPRGAPPDALGRS